MLCCVSALTQQKRGIKKEFYREEIQGFSLETPGVLV